MMFAGLLLKNFYGLCKLSQTFLNERWDVLPKTNLFLRLIYQELCQCTILQLYSALLSRATNLSVAASGALLR
jgi:hypothetical protein